MYWMLARYRELFGENKHPFTGVDYVAYYSDLIRAEGAEVEVIFANDPRADPQAHQACTDLRYPLPCPHQAPSERCRRRAGLRSGRYPHQLR